MSNKFFKAFKCLGDGWSSLSCQVETKQWVVEEHTRTSLTTEWTCCLTENM